MKTLRNFIYEDLEQTCTFDKLGKTVAYCLQHGLNNFDKFVEYVTNQGLYELNSKEFSSPEEFCKFIKKNKIEFPNWTYEYDIKNNQYICTTQVQDKNIILFFWDDDIAGDLDEQFGKSCAVGEPSWDNNFMRELSMKITACRYKD